MTPKHLRILLVVVFAGIASVAQAQTHVGVRGGVGGNVWILPDPDQVYVPNSAGLVQRRPRQPSTPRSSPASFDSHF